MTDTTKRLKSILEAILLASDQPLSARDLLGLFSEDERPEREELIAALDELATSYEGRGMELGRSASGYRIRVPAKFSPWISRLLAERPPRFSRAMLETLAIIAYRQPVTRGDIEDIRGIAVNTNIIRALQEREWIRVVGHRDVPGRPELLATTKQFLDYFDLKGLSELPSLADIKDFEQIDPVLDLPIDAPESASPENVDPAGSMGSGHFPERAGEELAQEAVTRENKTGLS